MTPFIRKRIPAADDAAISLLIRRLLFPFARRTNPALTFDKRELIIRLNRGRVLVACARKGGEPEAFVLSYVRNGALWVDMLAVHERRQGTGWGNRLMEAAERSGRKRGCAAAYLYVDKENDGAQRFYRRSGYTINRYIPQANCYLLTKPLDA